MTGFETFLILSHSANWSRMSISVAVASAISRMSAPAANALSFPVMIMHFTASSASDSSSAATRSVMSCREIAFSTSGRFSCMSAYPCSLVRVTMSDVMISFSGGIWWGG